MNGKYWSDNCFFRGNNLYSVKSSREDCVKLCYENIKCTHYTWAEDKGGTCYLKKGLVSKLDAVEFAGASRCGLVKRNLKKNKLVELETYEAEKKANLHGKIFFFYYVTQLVQKK